MRQLHVDAIADVEPLLAAHEHAFIGGDPTRTNVPFGDAPVTSASNRSPMRDATSSAAADFRT